MDLEELIFQHDLIGKLKKMSETNDSEEGFSLEDMFEVMEQITKPIDVFKQSSLLGKRTRERDRGQAKCHGCGQVGHYTRDNPSCFRKMKKKSQDYRRRKAEELQTKINAEPDKLDRADTEKKPKLEYKPETDDEDSEDEQPVKTDNSPEPKRHKKKTFFP